MAKTLRVAGSIAGISMALALTACGSTPDAPAADSTAATSTAPTQAPASPSADRDIPANDLTHEAGATVAYVGPGYEDAISVFGQEQVDASQVAVERIATALMADCDRWNQAEGADPLTAVTGVSTQEFIVEFATLNTAGALYALPETIEDGAHTPAADAAEGCSISPMRAPTDGWTISVDRSEAAPRLTVEGRVGFDLTLGDTTYTLTNLGNGDADGAVTSDVDGYRFSLVPTLDEAGQDTWVLDDLGWSGAFDLTSVEATR